MKIESPEKGKLVITFADNEHHMFDCFLLCAMEKLIVPEVPCELGVVAEFVDELTRMFEGAYEDFLIKTYGTADTSAVPVKRRCDEAIRFI